MSTIPLFTPFLHDEIKIKITSRVRKQLTLGNNIQCTTVTGVNVTNLADVSKQNILHRQLMTIESIYDKAVVNSKNKEKFCCGLFYVIIPNQGSKSATFTFLRPTWRRQEEPLTDYLFLLEMILNLIHHFYALWKLSR